MGFRVVLRVLEINSPLLDGRNVNARFRVFFGTFRTFVTRLDLRVRVLENTPSLFFSDIGTLGASSDDKRFFRVFRTGTSDTTSFRVLFTPEMDCPLLDSNVSFDVRRAFEIDFVLALVPRVLRTFVMRLYLRVRALEGATFESKFAIERVPRVFRPPEIVTLIVTVTFCILRTLETDFPASDVHFSFFLSKFSELEMSPLIGVISGL